MEETVRVRFMLAISVAVLLFSALAIVYFEGLSIWSAVMFLTVAIIAAVAMVLVSRAVRDIRSGVPIQDERSRAISARAGFYSFYISMYVTLAIGVLFVLFEDEITVPNSELLFVMVAIMGSVHIGISTYLNRKGRGTPA